MSVELMERNHSGIFVQMIWHGGDTITVDVVDPLGDFTIRPPKGKELDAFHHPYSFPDAFADERDDPFAPRHRCLSEDAPWENIEEQVPSNGDDTPAPF